MKRYGPDSLNSWFISVACCFINMMMYGMARLSGVLFVASVPRFNVDRESASFPYTFANFMRNTSGPLVGYLGHKFGVRAVTTFGSVLGAVGVGLCYFAESISTVTLLWGAVFGLGFGLGNILLPVSINQHFDKHRATASGISFSGACLGSFVLPPVVEILINTYGLSGTFLFLSGFVLNCVPAALMLRKPDFEIKPPNPCDYEARETESIVSGVKVRLYTVEGEPRNMPQKTNTISKASTEVCTVPIAEATENYSSLTFEERMKRLSTQTLLSDYSIRMSTSEPLDVEQIIENSKGRRQVDPKVLESETLSLSSHNTTNSEKDDVFEKDFRSSSVQYEKPFVPYVMTKAVSSEYLAPDKRNGHFAENCKEAYHNYAYQVDIDEVNVKNQLPKSSSLVHKNTDSHSLCNTEIYINSSGQKVSDNYKFLSKQLKMSSSDKANYYQQNRWSGTDNFKFKNGSFSSTPPEKDISKTQEESRLGSFSIIFDPMFVLIAIVNAIYCFTFVCMITIIVDYARDLHIGISNEKYVLMTLSVGDLFGRLGLGWVTDRGYMSTTAFAALCFACQGLVVSALVWSGGFIVLIILVTLYGVSEAGLILIFPIIIAQYIDHDKQTVAIPSSNFLSGPLCLAVAPLIGYFRDDIGSYNYIFFGIGILSAACCFTMILAPYVAKCRKRC